MSQLNNVIPLDSIESKVRMQPNHLNKEALIQMYMYTYRDHCHTYDIRVHMKQAYRDISSFTLTQIVEEIIRLRSEMVYTY